MREEVVDKLTIQAVAHHAVAIAGYLEALNTQFWTAHCSKVEALPGLEKALGKPDSGWCRHCHFELFPNL